MREKLNLEENILRISLGGHLLENLAPKKEPIFENFKENDGISLK